MEITDDKSKKPKYDFIGFRPASSLVRSYIEELKEKFPEAYKNDSDVIRAGISQLHRQRIILKDEYFGGNIRRDEK